MQSCSALISRSPVHSKGSAGELRPQRIQPNRSEQGSKECADNDPLSFCESSSQCLSFIRCETKPFRQQVRGSSQAGVPRGRDLSTRLYHQPSSRNGLHHSHDGTVLEGDDRAAAGAGSDVHVCDQDLATCGRAARRAGE
jgi:hypothetical protein